MKSIYPWVVMLGLIPLQLYFFYFIATFVRKRIHPGPFWAKAVVIIVFFSQIPMLFLNIYNVWGYFK